MVTTLRANYVITNVIPLALLPASHEWKKANNVTASQTNFSQSKDFLSYLATVKGDLSTIITPSSPPSPTSVTEITASWASHHDLSSNPRTKSRITSRPPNPCPELEGVCHRIPGQFEQDRTAEMWEFVGVCAAGALISGGVYHRSWTLPTRRVRIGYLQGEDLLGRKSSSGFPQTSLSSPLKFGQRDIAHVIPPPPSDPHLPPAPGNGCRRR
ncbi:hypothetical protein F4824DRAFT_504885 [Ustulina deusta]|nr:hypothetical protein F4824DRAFT_504885 [Ustulina deusta]